MFRCASQSAFPPRAPGNSVLASIVTCRVAESLEEFEGSAGRTRGSVEATNGTAPASSTMVLTLIDHLLDRCVRMAVSVWCGLSGTFQRPILQVIVRVE